MNKNLEQEAWQSAITGSPALRKEIFRTRPRFFAMFYFIEYFKYKTPDFHFDLYDDCRDLAHSKIDEAMWCVFRDGAKTSIAKIAFLVWCICYQKKNYIGWDSYDGDNAESALFDTTVALQTNKRLISDFGHLYYKKQSKQALMEAKMKRIKNFITEPSQYGKGVKITSITTQESIRGLITGAERLDMVIFDDFENNKTKDSPLVTKKVIDHINEYRSGMPAGAGALYLCNYLTDSGSVASIMDNLRDNPRARVRFIPVKDERGAIAWPAKFVNTREEADEINKTIEDPKRHVISLVAKRESLSKDGLSYETEMMLNPSQSDDLFFDREKVDAATKHAKEPKDINAGFKIWAKFAPGHRYGGGADTAEGIGGDHNASVWIDFTQKPNLVVASFQDNQLSNTQFGWELKRQGGVFGYPFVIPEINNTGYGTVAELINSEYPDIYQREQKNQTTNKIKKEYGWKATVGTVFEIMGSFKEGFESGELEILDVGLLREMRIFTKSHARIAGSGRQKGSTRHFDKLRAAALAWEARKWSTVKVGESYQQKPYEPTSEYESITQPSEANFPKDNNGLPSYMKRIL